MSKRLLAALMLVGLVALTGCTPAEETPTVPGEEMEDDMMTDEDSMEDESMEDDMMTDEDSMEDESMEDDMMTDEESMEDESMEDDSMMETETEVSVEANS